MALCRVTSQIHHVQRGIHLFLGKKSQGHFIGSTIPPPPKSYTHSTEVLKDYLFFSYCNSDCRVPLNHSLFQEITKKDKRCNKVISLCKEDYIFHKS